jgi:hypothetical protein
MRLKRFPHFKAAVNGLVQTPVNSYQFVVTALAGFPTKVVTTNRAQTSDEMY